ncbi:tetratricopeptide repeat protein [Mesorhizobium marinum]|uniref:tetratricopeptide repeat protein n=1 Tax=Mesorhizobium marinum TaxID=3228790 RepID=UPI003466F580
MIALSRRLPLLAALLVCGGAIAAEDAQPAGETPEATTGVDQERFGGPASDAAYGAYQRGLYMTALNLAMPRAEAGNAAAQTLVAEILSRGLGVKRDEAQAAKWYQLAAEQGVPEAQFQYALMLIDGRFVKKDTKGAYALMQSAAEAGNRLAQFNFAQLLVQREPGDVGMAKAVSYYQRAAEAGLADGQYAMSQIYANGAGGKPRDEAEARRWLLLAARQNFDTAQLDLATWLVEGRGGPRDLKAGFGWMKRAAEGGNVAAQNRLAKLYMGGIGTEPNAIDAAAWYFLARRRGLHDAEMDDFLSGLTDEDLKTALERANRLR